MTSPQQPSNGDAFPAGPVIPLLYQYNLLSDEKRLSELNTAIETTIGERDIVADLGSGMGVLTYLASQTAEHVYAVELDENVYRWSKTVLAENESDNVTLINDDVRDVSLHEPVDVVICEMLDTALITELQVPAMNYAVEELLAEDGTTVPYRTKTTVQLVESDYDFLGRTFRLPHYEAYGSREGIARSEEIVYHDVCFEECNDVEVNESVDLVASKSGIINGIRLNTYTQFTEGQEYTNPTSWLNPPLVLPLDRRYQVDSGDNFEVTLEYVLGGGLDGLQYSVTQE